MLRHYIVHIEHAIQLGILRHVNTVYLFEFQKEITVYSASVGTMTIYLRGYNAGAELSFTCTEGDTCYVECGENSCDPELTILTCYGKCFVACFDEATTNSTKWNSNPGCVNIYLSQSPSSAPTLAPTTAPSTVPTNTPSTEPTDSPTPSPTSQPTFNTALTQTDVSSWFNWFLGTIFTAMVLIIGVGITDAKKWRRNDLFRWHSLLAFGFYSIDFVSDIFFSMKLYLYVMDENEKFQVTYGIIFVSSIVFIITPMIGNLTQLNKELSKWQVDPILARTDTCMGGDPCKNYISCCCSFRKLF